jgi:hypothetical protein
MPVAHTAPVLVASGLGPTGNYYEFYTTDIIPPPKDSNILTSGISWTEANTDAISREHLGMTGHLVTILDQAENDFVLSLTDNSFPGSSLTKDINTSIWLGGKDDVVDGQWKWVTGEQFWQGDENGTVGPDIDYANWLTGEPNNYEGAHEDYLAMFGKDAAPIDRGNKAGLWNDMVNLPTNHDPAFVIGGYVVEYEISSIPIPPAVWLFGSGLIGLLGIARRKQA